LESEKKKDDVEEKISKEKLIGEIKGIRKEDLFKKKEKPTLWQKIKIIILGS
jgi:hypothetical protein